jgi:hypothetical protein
MRGTLRLEQASSTSRKAISSMEQKGDLVDADRARALRADLGVLSP